MTPDELLCQRTCTLIREAMPERVEQIRSDWNTIMSRFCQSEIQRFHNFIFTQYLIQPQQ